MAAGSRPPEGDGVSENERACSWQCAMTIFGNPGTPARVDPPSATDKCQAIHRGSAKDFVVRCCGSPRVTSADMPHRRLRRKDDGHDRRLPVNGNPQVVAADGHGRAGYVLAGW